MSLVGFRGKNHPQQVGKNGPDRKTDDRSTRWEDFNLLHERFNFTIDVAATPDNAKLPRYYTIEDDGLSKSWRKERVWCNPPYSEITEWVEKAWREFRNGAHLIVMLLPANRTEQKWWQKSVEPFRDRRFSSLTVEFLPGRMRFDVPGGYNDPRGNRPPFGCCLLIWTPR